MGCELINKHLPSLYRALKSNGQKKFVDITMEEDAPVDPSAAEQPAEPEPAEPAAPVEPAEPPAPATPSTAAPAESPMGIESELATPGTVRRDLPDFSTPVARLPWFPGTSSTSVTRFPVIPEESLEPELRRLVDAKEQSQGVRRPGGDLEELEAGNGVVHKMDTATQRSGELLNAEPRPMHEGKPLVLWCRMSKEEFVVSEAEAFFDTTHFYLKKKAAASELSYDSLEPREQLQLDASRLKETEGIFNAGAMSLLTLSMEACVLQHKRNRIMRSRWHEKRKDMGLFLEAFATFFFFFLVFLRPAVALGVFLHLV